MTHIEIWVYPQCMASAVTGPLDVLTVANAVWAIRNKDAEFPLFSWSIRSLDGLPVRTPAQFSLGVDGAIEMDSRADVVLLPGIYVGNGIKGLLETVHNLAPLMPLLRQRHANGCLLASNCSASFLLAESGLLDGGQATTAWWLERAFQARYPQVALKQAEVLVENQNIVTTGAATTYLNLAYHLLERFAGHDIATSVAKTLLIDANRASQMPYMQLMEMTQQENQTHSDKLVHRAQKWMRQHSHLAFRLPALANYLAVSERTVIRHFHQIVDTTPASYAQQIKMDIAKRLLETTTLTLEQIAERTGYSDPSSFRRLFKRHSGLSPAAYREKFGPVKRHKKGVGSIAATATATTTAASAATAMTSP
ncbi:MAG: helix-turn-helix domain-containing protein [Burkholderiales bacterium]|nr:helix-turn-helix domain-containing protein [Burkholderiales bacterium]